MLRVCKTGGIISIGFTYVKNASIDSNLKTNKTAENELYSTDQIKDFYKNNIRNVYFEFDAYRENPSINRQSIIVLRIKK